VSRFWGGGHGFEGGVTVLRGGVTVLRGGARFRGGGVTVSWGGGDFALFWPCPKCQGNANFGAPTGSSNCCGREIWKASVQTVAVLNLPQNKIVLKSCPRQTFVFDRAVNKSSREICKILKKHEQTDTEKNDFLRTSCTKCQGKVFKKKARKSTLRKHLGNGKLKKKPSRALTVAARKV
jgi:hypothetical protein